MNVVLIGYRGSGKSTVGRLLADRRQCDFVDTDGAIVADAGRSISAIFKSEGEAGFRRRERRAIRSAVSTLNRVISVGGGALESDENRRLLRAYGTVVWLQAPPEVLWERMKQDASTTANRPDLTVGGLEEVIEVLARRAPLYASTAHTVIPVAGLSPEQVANLIQEHGARKREP
jgi:shikimate kinase